MTSTNPESPLPTSPLTAGPFIASSFIAGPFTVGPSDPNDPTGDGTTVFYPNGERLSTWVNPGDAIEEAARLNHTAQVMHATDLDSLEAGMPVFLDPIGDNPSLSDQLARVQLAAHRVVTLWTRYSAVKAESDVPARAALLAELADATAALAMYLPPVRTPQH